MAKNAREIAHAALAAFRKSGTFPELFLKDALHALPRRDAALCTALTYGVLQNMALLDFYIGEFSNIPIKKISPRVLDALRLGIYQLKMMDRIPEHAAVNESVNLARREGAKSAGFCNAVLRAVLRADTMPEPSGDRLDVLAIKYSHPKWMVRRLISHYGDETEQILAENNKIPPICVRVNTLKTSTDALVSKLGDEGVSASAHPWLKSCVIIKESGDIARLNSFCDGLFHVCDPASQMAAIALGARAGDRILDACAAPGGKSMVLAQEMENSGELISCDIHEHKLKLMQNGAARLHITNLKTALRDARESTGEFDAVLCDVPCSGLGVIRKKPEIRFKSEDEIARLPEIQRDILESAAKTVKPGGCLVYSTCTILPCENMDVCDAFLKEHPEFALEPIELSCPNGENGGAITLLPHVNETDGFFICKIRRSL